jgi:hypothetical protein
MTVNRLHRLIDLKFPERLWREIGPLLSVVILLTEQFPDSRSLFGSVSHWLFRSYPLPDLLSIVTWLPRKLRKSFLIEHPDSLTALCLSEQALRYSKGTNLYQSDPRLPIVLFTRPPTQLQEG